MTEDASGHRNLVAEPWKDFALLDSGGGRKLECYGAHRIVRPEPMALWTPASQDWEADAEFVPGADEEGGGRWRFEREMPEAWDMEWQGIKFRARCTPFRHLGFFPDMAPQWDWMRGHSTPGRTMLNLFGYSGVASLAMREKGADVVHVDASKKAVTYARENEALQPEQGGIRWIVDDAAKFAAREVRRGRAYHGIILDPPKYGRGPEGEMWRIEEGLAPLLADCRTLLEAEGRFLVLTLYAMRISALALAGLLGQALAGLGGTIEHGDMALREEARGLLLPMALYARWSR